MRLATTRNSAPRWPSRSAIGATRSASPVRRAAWAAVGSGLASVLCSYSTKARTPVSSHRLPVASYSSAARRPAVTPSASSTQAMWWMVWSWSTSARASLVAELAGQLPGGREHPGRPGVVAGQPAHPCGGGQQPGPVRVGQVAERGQPAAGHRDRLLPLGGPAELVGHHAAEPPQRVGAPEGLVQPQGLVHDLERLVPASLAAQGHGQPLDQLGQGSPVLLSGARLALEQRDGPGEVVGGLGVGGGLHRPVAGHAQVADEPAVLAARPAPGQVVGQVGRVGLQVVGVDRLERGGDGEVEPAPADGRGVGQQGLADQLMREGVAGRPALGGRDQPGPLGLVEGVEQVAAGLAGHPLDQVELEHPAPHGGREQRPPGGLGQPGQPLTDHHADTGGELEVLDAEVVAEPALVVEEHARLGQVEVDLLGEERVALALGVDPVDEGGRWLLPGQPGHKGRDVLLGQRPQRDPRHQPLPHQLVEDPGQRRGRLDLVVPEGADDHDRHVGQVRGQVLEQQQGRLVGPVQVLEHEHERAFGGGPPDELAHAEPQVAAGLLGREVQRRRDLGDDQSQGGGDAGDLGGGLAEGVAQGGGTARGHHALLDHLGEGQIRGPALVLGAVTCKDPQPVGVSLGVDLLQQPGLADPGLARDEHERAVPDPGVLERPSQVGPLPVAPDERALDRPDPAAGVVPPPLGLVQPPALREPAQPVEPPVDEREPSRRVDRVPHGRGDQDLASGRLGHRAGRRHRGGGADRRSGADRRRA